MGNPPLQLVSDPRLASVRERHWWTIFKRWACNDVPAGISAHGTPRKSRGWLNQQRLAVLQGIKDAWAIRDYACMKCLQNDLCNLACQLSVPRYVVGTLVVPNLSPLQKSAIHRVCRKMVISVAGPAWEKKLFHALLKGLFCYCTFMLR